MSCACGRDNRAHRQYCGGCGDKLTPPCGGCGFENDRDDRFCGGCGSALVASAASLARTVVVNAARASIPTITREELAELLAPIGPQIVRLPDAAIDQNDLDRLFGGMS